MPPKITPVFLAAAVLMLTGCEPTDQSAPRSFPDGAKTINKNMRGIWDAPGGLHCRWWIVSNGTITNPGNTTGPPTRRRQKSGKAAKQSQTVVIGTGNVGHTIRSDKCGGWKLR